MKLLARLVLVAFLALIVAPGTASAAEFKSGDTIDPVPAGQTLNDDLYVAGSTVTISGTVNGDLIVAGSDVEITGTVTGSVWAVGSQVTISGTVNNSVRSAGSDVTITGKVDRDVLTAGSDVELASGSQVSRDVVAAGTTVNLNGTVGRNVKLGAQNATIAGAVGGSVQAAVQTLTLGSTAKVTGNIDYRGANELKRDSGSEVAGTITYTKVTDQKNGGESFGGRLAGQFYWFLASILLLLGILLYARRAAVQAGDLIIQRPVASGVLGLGFLILTPLVMFILLVLIVGIPLSLITLMGYVLVLYSAKIFAALAAGHAILRRKQDNFWFTFGAGVIGLALYYLLTAIPVVGWIIGFLTLLFGTGAQLLLFRQAYEDNKKKYGV